MKRQEIINREIVPELGPDLIIRDGQTVASELETATILYLGHEPETVIGEDGAELTQTRAFAVRVPNPVTRAAAIDAAERAAYGLHSADEVASFNAALARKSRQGEDADEVADHDQFIAWVKAELTRIGVTR